MLVPNFLYGTSQGSIIPIVPLFAHQLGSSLATAALVAAMLPLGQWAFNIPSGWLVGRFGERRTMYFGAVIAATGAVVCWAAPTIAVLGIGVLVVGAAAAVFTLARQTYVTVAVSPVFRGRAMSLLGGANRAGVMVGPFLTAMVIRLADDTRTAFVVAVTASLTIIVLLRLLPGDPTAEDAVDPKAATNDAGRVGIRATFRTRYDVLLRVGTATGLLNFMRTCRQIIVPLVGVTLGLHPAQVALVVGIGAVLEFAFFYPGGLIMDRFGRLWTGVPSMLMFAVSHAVLAVAAELVDPVAWYVGASLVMAVGNGMTSGFVAAIGSDLADQSAPAAFLGVWRSITDLGPASAPLAISGLTGVFSLAIATGSMTAVAVTGAGMLLRYVPRYLPSRKKSAAEL